MRISLYYFFLIGALGLFLPYMPPYYESLGFSGRQIALIGSLSSVMMIFAPPLWGFWADRSRRPTVLIRVATVGAALSFILMLWARSFSGVLIVMGVVSLFYTSISSLTDSVALAAARRTGAQWSRWRMWGSVGFVAGGSLLSLWRGEGASPAAVLPMTLGFLVLAAFTAFGVPRDPDAAPTLPSAREALALLREPPLLLFLGASLLHWAAMAPYHLFLAVHLDRLGADPRWMGVAVGLAVGTEIGIMWAFQRVATIPARALFFSTFLLGAARWLATSFADTGPSIALLQALHGLTFGAFFVAGLLHLEGLLPPQLRATGRALFTSVVFGVGGVLGNMVSGQLYDTGGAALSYQIAAGAEIVALIPLLASFALLRRRDRPPEALASTP